MNIYMINFIKNMLFSCKNPIKTNPLGRWGANNNQKTIDRKIYLANQDHCGSSQYKCEPLKIKLINKFSTNYEEDSRKSYD